MEVIDSKTNNKIFQTTKFAKKKPAFVESGEYSWVCEPSHVELDALSGFVYFRGLLRLNLHNVNHLFAEYEAHFVFGAIVSKNKFKFLFNHIIFDDYADSQKNWSTDHFAVMQIV